jgi:nucleoside 2-deoxyribosyltransferase
MLIYIAAPLFSAAERRFNLELRDFIHQLSFDTYLPQLDGGELHKMVEDGMNLHEAKAALFREDLSAVKQSQIILFVLDGRVPDEGACIEAGIGFALGKTLIGFKTDYRSFMHGEDNLMITGILTGPIARDFEQLKRALEEVRMKALE